MDDNKEKSEQRMEARDEWLMIERKEDRELML